MRKMVKKEVPIKEIKADALPVLRKQILERLFTAKERTWGERYTQAITMPETNEDLLFRYLCDLEETGLRMQAVIMGEKVMPGIGKSELFKRYINSLKAHVGRIINTLQDMGYDMETPPEPE
jgi:hypothetical protein